MEAGARKESPRAGSRASQLAINLLVLAATLRARFDVADPRLVLLYFYEGNDLEDNVGRVRRGKGLLREGRLDAEAFDDLLRRSLRPGPEAGYSGSFLATRFTLELSDSEVDLALEVFERSLRFLRSDLRAPRIFVVYVPSVLGCYAFHGTVSAWDGEERRPALYPAELVRERSDRIAKRVAEAAALTGAGFIDTREAVREAAGRTVIHGPRDWHHFNRSGYEAFSAAIVAGRREEPAHEPARQAFFGAGKPPRHS